MKKSSSTCRWFWMDSVAKGNTSMKRPAPEPPRLICRPTLARCIPCVVFHDISGTHRHNLVCGHKIGSSRQVNFIRAYLICVHTQQERQRRQRQEKAPSITFSGGYPVPCAHTILSTPREGISQICLGDTVRFSFFLSMFQICQVLQNTTVYTKSASPRPRGGTQGDP